METKSKNIIIIGGSGTIGKELSKSLIKYNNVIIIDKQKPKFKHINQFYYKVDILNINSFRNCFKIIIKKFIIIDTVINCSYPKDKNWGRKFESLSDKQIKDHLYIQLSLPIILAKVILKYFLAKKKGNLIFFSSILGINAPKFEHYKNTGIYSPLEYSIAKAGLIMATKYLAKVYGNKNIRINCVSPGGIKNKQAKNFINNYKKSCLTKGLLDPIDISGVVKFLVSKDSLYINGQNIVIDDGWSL